MGLCEALDRFWSSKAKRCIAPFAAIIDSFFFGAFFFGINALIPSYDSMGVFRDYCNGDDCSQKEKMFGYSFAAGLISQMLLSPVMGLLMDRVGLRVTKIISLIIYTLGCIMVAFVTVETGLLLYPGVILVAIGSLSSMFCNLHIAAFFPPLQGLIISLVNGAYDSSSTVASIIARTSSFIPMRTSFIILGCCGLLSGCLIAVIFLTQWETDMKPGKQITTMEIEVELEESPPDYYSEVDQVIQCRFPTLKDCILSKTFLVIVIYFMPGLLRFGIYFSQLNEQLLHSFPNDYSKVKRLLEVSGYVSMCAILSAPFTGLIMDFSRRRYRVKLENKLSCKTNNVPTNTIYWTHVCALAPTLVILASLSLYVSGTLFVNGQEWIFYTQFVAIVLLGSIIAGVTSTAVLTSFPVDRFGVLMGLVSLTGGIFSLIQYGLLHLPIIVGNIVMVVTSVVMFIPPIFLLFKAR